MFYKSQYLQEINRIFKLQLSLGGVTIVILAIFTQNIHIVISAILGTLLVVIPAFIYLLMIVRNKWVALPEVIIKRHKNGLIFKFMVNLLLFALIFNFYKQCNLLSLFATYIIVLSSYWLVLGINKYGINH
jgi:F0F1-type ATP synthase assembly protein I